MSRYQDLIKIVNKRNLKNADKVAMILAELRRPAGFKEEEIYHLFKIIRKLDPNYLNRDLHPLEVEVIKKRSEKMNKYELIKALLKECERLESLKKWEVIVTEVSKHSEFSQEEIRDLCNEYTKAVIEEFLLKQKRMQEV